MSALTNAILANYPQVVGHAPMPAREVVIHGEVTAANDPFWHPYPQRRVILKRTNVESLPTTVVRWLALGRKITGIEEF